MRLLVDLQHLSSSMTQGPLNLPSTRKTTRWPLSSTMTLSMMTSHAFTRQDLRLHPDDQVRGAPHLCCKAFQAWGLLPTRQIRRSALGCSARAQIDDTSSE